MRLLTKLRRTCWLPALAGLGLLTSCVVVEEGPGPGPRPYPPEDGPRVCTAEYVPVCARDGSDRRTFSNACMARRAGYRVIRPGECRQYDDDDNYGEERPRFCTREYRPVCARRGGDVRTFGNACAAESDGYRIIAPGEC
jgi:hypothetical protein